MENGGKNSDDKMAGRTTKMAGKHTPVTTTKDR